MSEDVVGPYPPSDDGGDGEDADGVVGPYPPSDGDGAGDADGVVGPYPPSDDGGGDDAGGVVGPYPPSDEGDDHSEDVVGPYPSTGENMDGSSCNVTGPYPPMPVGNAMDPAPVGPMAAAVAPPPPAPLQPVVSEPPRRWEPPDWAKAPVLHQPRLEAYENGRCTRSMSLLGARYFTIGRNGAQADIVVPDASVSRAQAAIVNSSSATFVCDLDSAHGTWIDEAGRTLAIPQLGVRLDPSGTPTKLSEGTTLRFGTFAKTVFRVTGLEQAKVERWQPPAWVHRGTQRPSMRLEVRSNSVSNPYLAHLAAGEGGDYDEVLPLTESCTRFGRSAAHADIVVRDDTLSRQHAAIVHTEDESFLVDLGSAAGSFVDGTRAEAQRPLRLADGAVISLGDCPTTWTFRCEQDGGGSAAPSGKRKRER